MRSALNSHPNNTLLFNEWVKFKSSKRVETILAKVDLYLRFKPAAKEVALFREDYNYLFSRWENKPVAAKEGTPLVLPHITLVLHREE